MDGKSIIEVTLETARDLKMGKTTMRQLEALALPPVQKFTPHEIRKIRETANVSRGVMAKLLNVGVTTVQKWENGNTHPDGAALKLLNLVHTHGIVVLTQ